MPGTCRSRRDANVQVEKATWSHHATMVSMSQDAPPLGTTDLTRWRLRVSDGGRHVWHYLESDAEAAAWPQMPEDKYWLGLDMVRAAPAH